MSTLTKKALLVAFGELLEEKPFNKITITDITAKCGLNRMTFYYHFENIYELMIWGLETQMREVSKDYINYKTGKRDICAFFILRLKEKRILKKYFKH